MQQPLKLTETDYISADFQTEVVWFGPAYYCPPQRVAESDIVLITEDKLAYALQQVLNDQNMQVSARRIGENIRTEDGVGAVVKLVKKTLKIWN